MTYTIDKNAFENYFITNESFKHSSGTYFKLFPYVTSPNVDFTKLESVLGQVLCKIQKIEPEIRDEEDIINDIVSETDVELGLEEEFREVVKQLFFETSGELIPLNLMMIEQNECHESSEKKLAEYLGDVLGDTDVLQASIKSAKSSLKSASNVLESLLYSKLTTRTANVVSKKNYFRVVDGLHKKFEDDFSYILSSDVRTREYLLKLFEFYYFSYTAQTFLQLNRMFDGEREQNVPLYFSLEWEATKIHGKYITEGWNILQETIQDAYSHAVVLEMLNVNDNDSQMDYIEIRKYIEEHPDENMALKSIIDELCTIYAEHISDCPLLDSMIQEDASKDTEDSINLLYRLVKTQFDNTSRGAASGRYSDKFEDYCMQFLKNRGRNGYVLNISEDTLILLTKVSIKDNEKMKLSDVFKEFESRGVFFEKEVKEQVANYYERLNLIEKKSDSGDAKYVKRIL